MTALPCYLLAASSRRLLRYLLNIDLAVSHVHDVYERSEAFSTAVLHPVNQE